LLKIFWVKKKRKSNQKSIKMFLQAKVQDFPLTAKLTIKNTKNISRGSMNIQDKVQKMVGLRDQNKVKRDKLLKGEQFAEQEKNKINANWDDKQKSLLKELKKKFQELPVTNLFYLSLPRIGTSDYQHTKKTPIPCRIHRRRVQYGHWQFKRS
jgi:hypothetical protein